ncbi:AraC family transcriptional regulator [Nitrosovibrio tenuis]|uniref:AraC family transcriptional regulator, activator of mtrCDE n=1 Tax=Nitrosovibrio tenuis TaxID=1233 RepID=A0A1H7RRT9_9PROT|nr:AraC family transcriptional regulator [Nitrosovibrio tenuis]SEL62728.1 AraC family transcriptional regulator, activator of mtrCDE [Nitrosovibrio tenuis]
MDWLSRLFELIPVQGRVDLRCLYGAPWRIEQGPAATGEMPYHAVVAGTAILEAPGSGQRRLLPGDILLLPHGDFHVLHDGAGAAPNPAHNRDALNVTFSENAGTGERFDLLCGHFAFAAQHHHLLQSYLPRVLVVQTAGRSASGDASTAQAGNGARLAGLVSLMRIESAADNLGGRAMLNALSTAMFTLIVRLSSEAGEAPQGLLALAGYPRLAPALAVLFREPARPWSLPELAKLCNMSRATLARHFQEKLGKSASDLLTDIRMTLAANELKKSSASTAAVAEAVGYQSEAAFQRVFKQRMGMTPARWRRAEQVPDSTRAFGQEIHQPTADMRPVARK